MSALSIQPPFPIFTESDGLPLENGYIWIGAAFLPPQTNPIQVYWDAALTVQATQPIRTLGGYPSRNGTPARLYVNAPYSILVQNKNGSTIYSTQDSPDRYSSDMVSIVGFNGQTGTVADLTQNDGADWIGYQPPGAGIARTAQEKMRDIVSVKDFGAVGDDSTDDTLAIQAAIDYANTIGAAVYMPTGVYRITSGLTINNNTDTSDAFKASLIGDSSAGTRIRGMPGNYNMLDITGGSGPGVHSHQVIRGIFFVKEDFNGALIACDNVAFLSLEDVCTINGEYGFYATDILSTVFYNCNIRFAKYGMRCEYTNFSYPNAITMIGSVVGLCSNYGIWVSGGSTFNMIGGSVEGNGLGGTDPTKFGVLLNNSGVQGSVSGNFSGVYFEQNVGTADIWLANSAEPVAANISGCSFNRIDSTYYTMHNVLVETSNVGVKQSVNIAGSGFKYFNTYVPNSARKYIAVNDSAGGVSTVAWSGCFFQSSIEEPTIENEILLTSFTDFAGWTTVVFENAWADAGVPSPLASYTKDKFGVVRLQGGAIRASDSSATIFTLPVGYRPTADLLISSYGEISTVPSAVCLQIEASGAVHLLNAVPGNKVSFNCITFQTN